MSSRAIKWAIALAASVALHAGAAIWLGPQEEGVEIAGGAQAEIAILGNAFQDSVLAGTETDSVQPTETDEVSDVPPVEAQQVAEAEPDAVQPTPVQPAPPKPVETTSEPVQPAQAAEPVNDAPAEPAQAAQSEQVVDIEVVEEIDTGVPVAAREPVQADTAAETTSVAALDPTTPDNAETTPVETRETEALAPVEEQDLPQTPDTAPRPSPRPEQIAEAKPRTQPKQAREKPRKTEKAAPKPRKQRAGSGGKSSQTAKRGSADGSQRAKKAQSGNKGRSREAGNAAVSNYPGKVYSKLRRSLRYPSQARRQGVRGEVHVRFTVSSSGGVGSVRVARSSGSSILDQAALDTVRRAAPFPAIPAGAGRSSWSFTVPLQFRR